MKRVEVKASIAVPLYGGRIDVVISDSDNAYDPTKKNFGVDDEALKGYDAVCLGRNSGSSRIYPVIFCRSITPGMIAHESKHLVNKIFTDVDVLLDLKNDEAEAYLLGWIVNRIWEVRIKFDKKMKANEEKRRISQVGVQNKSSELGVGNTKGVKSNTIVFNRKSAKAWLYRC